MVRSSFPFGAALLAVAVAILVSSSAFAALEECRLLRQPDIQGDKIVFAYGGDLWVVARGGGVAQRLTTHEGIEAFPKLSPDGKTIAFTAEYDGNLDAFTVPVEGGEPKRLTWHPRQDEVTEWYPDGKGILIRSARAAFMYEDDRFYRVPMEGGFEEVLPLTFGGYAGFSPDGARIAFVSPSYDRRTWKRYKGGNAPEIWIYDFARNFSEKITDWPGSDEWPMWHGRTIYYASDRGGRTVNLWAYDLDTKKHRQVTNFTDYDVKWPGIGGDSIVFEKGGYLHVMDLPGEKSSMIQVLVPADKPATRPEYRNVARWTTGWDLSPSAKRAVIEARGDLFTVPAEKGDARNLSRTPGARERDPAWSPDGKWIAYLSDASGEYEIHVVGSDGVAPDRQVTKGGGTFRFAPVWSPDSARIAFSDKEAVLWWVDVATGKLTKVDKGEEGEIHDYQWSADSRWLAYSRLMPNQTTNQVVLYSTETGRATPVTSGLTDDFNPTFDPEGKYLYFISRRTLSPVFGAFEFNFFFTATDKIYVASLRKDVGSPLAPESDEEKGEEKKDGEKKDGEKKDEKEAKEADKKDEKKEGEGEKKEPPPLQIDLEGLGSRLVEIPVTAGRYSGLRAFKGKLIYASLDRPSGLDDFDGGSALFSLNVFDFEKREAKAIISGVQGSYGVSKDGGKILYRTRDAFGIVEAKEGKKAGDGKIAADVLMATVDPKREWMQIFNEAWRLERDFYYDPAMGGLDWKAVGERYRQLVPYVAHRSDLNYVLGELIGELSTSHAYVGGGENPPVSRVGVGLLGADFDLDAESGLYRFKKIYRERHWHYPVAAPLGEPGVDVREGDYLISVNGVPVRAPQNVYAAFIGTAGKQTRIAVGSSPDDPNARTFTVRPIEGEEFLRYVEWVEANRRKVEKATGGRVAYIHVPNTSTAGIREFTRQYYPQVDKQGIIVDERFNGGGSIPDFFIERLQRSTWVYWSPRDINPFKTPSAGIDGPKCILINQYAGSGGDAFPYYFRLKGLGPVIGMRTWGGLVGFSHFLPFMDGGVVTMPDFGMWDPKTAQWVVENYGVDPDPGFEVENLPHEMVMGKDAQLERAIQYVMDQLKANPPKKPQTPKYKVQQ